MNLQPVTKLFNLRSSASLKTHGGDIIRFEVLPDRTDGTEAFMPPRNDAYIFPVEALIDVGIAIDMNMPCLIHGLHGSGKSTLFEQYCNRTNRPTMRVQHTVDTEVADIVGNWSLEGDTTRFHYGPLPRAMKEGLVYIADEYDFALPNVLSVYQGVLEGGPLFIKNAPADMAIVEPHPDFRICATGNTNGSGDETGLYQGTQVQNAANYSRFTMTIALGYSKDEPAIITSTLGNIPESDMKLLMEFVKKVRDEFDKKEITNTLSTREILGVVRLAILRGRGNLNFRYGVERAFVNRMSSTDAAVVMRVGQRVFGW